MLIVFTGNGKGKTTAALGVALRSLGWGERVAIIQFIKGNKETGEWKFIKEIASLSHCFIVDICQLLDSGKYSITETEIIDVKNKEYKKSCEKAWEFAKETILNKEHDLIILDEINNALHYDLLDKKDVLNFIRNYSDKNSDSDSDIDIVLTGRYASEDLINLSDLTTEMKEIKHPFQKGRIAKKGIDY